MLLQSPKPELQVKSQLEPEHIAAATLSCTPQSKPHMPQFIKFVRVSTSHPVRSSLSQSLK